MPLNNETKSNQTKPYFHINALGRRYKTLYFPNNELKKILLLSIYNDGFSFE